MTAPAPGTGKGSFEEPFPVSVGGYAASFIYWGHPRTPAAPDGPSSISAGRLLAPFSPYPEPLAAMNYKVFLFNSRQGVPEV